MILETIITEIDNAFSFELNVCLGFWVLFAFLDGVGFICAGIFRETPV